MSSNPVHKLKVDAFVEEAEKHFESGKPGLFIPPSPSSPTALGIGNTVSYKYDSVAEAFPEVECGHRPLGNIVLLQIRQPKSRTRGGLLIDSESRKTEHYNTQIGKVRAIGSLCFHRRDTGEPWPEGAWCKVGDYVRIPKYQGDRFTIDIEVDEEETDHRTGQKKMVRGRDEVVFCFIKDIHLIALVDDPLTIKAFL
jgi:co-chaperonin GroES (HSP10)